MTQGGQADERDLGAGLEESAAEWRAKAIEIATEYFEPLAEELDREQRYPTEHIDTFVETGLSGMLVPREHGGSALSMEATCVVIEQVSAACASTGAILAAYALGAAPLPIAGTPEQQRELLRRSRRRRGDQLRPDRGRRRQRCSRHPHHRRRGRRRLQLDGEKIYIGNGGVAKHYVVFAKTEPEAGARGITAFMVQQGHTRRRDRPL